MTATPGDALPTLALTLLTQRAGSTANAKTVAAAARRAYDDLARVSAPLIGQAGVDALTGRALHLTKRQYPWLAQAPDREDVDGPFIQVIVGLEQQDPAVATDAAGAVFATLIGLLVNFIGESLTVDLLRKAWPEAFSGSGTEEHY